MNCATPAKGPTPNPPASRDTVADLLFDALADACSIQARIQQPDQPLGFVVDPDTRLRVDSLMSTLRTLANLFIRPDQLPPPPERTTTP